MRKEFAEAIINISRNNDKIVFLTGDLGFMALEGVKEILGDRFINAGVAEQNMVTMAASLAYEGFVPFVYSISPFITQRPYEQLRNDVCLHNLPVKIVANGGGYGYGIMGGTHHNIEDIGSMRILPNMKVYVPFTKTDVAESIQKMLEEKRPTYLRLNLASNQEGIPRFTQWRNIRPVANATATVIATGTVADNLFKLTDALKESLDIWLLSEFPVTEVPAGLLQSITATQHVITLEEHTGQCSMHETLASLLLKQLRVPISYQNLFAGGYPSGRYGSQQWHLEENNLAGDGLASQIKQFISHHSYVS
jgi:transketolase